MRAAAFLHLLLAFASFAQTFEVATMKLHPPGSPEGTATTQTGGPGTSDGEMKQVYTPVDAFGQDKKPSLQDYPRIPWDKLDIAQFNRIPGFFRRIMRHYGHAWETFHIIPIESGRGCPYGCEFCTVTGFFGDSIRFRTNQSIVDELLLLKARARDSNGKIAVFFVDDNFAINVKRTKSLLRDIIAAGAQTSTGWTDQRQPSPRPGTAGPDRRIRRQVDLHRHGVARPRQSRQREEELQ